MSRLMVLFYPLSGFRYILNYSDVRLGECICLACINDIRGAILFLLLKIIEGL